MPLKREECGVSDAAPQMIPDRWRDSPEDELRFDLPDKTDDELVALGWKKVDFPSYAAIGSTFFNNRYDWNSSTRTFDATELEDYEKEHKTMNSGEIF